MWILSGLQFDIDTTINQGTSELGTPLRCVHFEALANVIKPSATQQSTIILKVSIVWELVFITYRLMEWLVFVVSGGTEKYRGMT